MGKLLGHPFKPIVFKISLPCLFAEELLKDLCKGGEKGVADRVQLLIQYPRQFVSGPKIPRLTQQTALQLNAAKMLRGKLMEHIVT